MTSVRLLWLVGIALFSASGGSLCAQSDVGASAAVLKVTAPDGEALDATFEPMAGVIDRYAHDRSILSRFYEVPSSPVRRGRLRELDATWREVLDDGLFDGLDRNGRVDFLLLRGLLDSHEREVVTEDARLDETAALVPFADAISELFEARQKVEPIAGRVAADRLNALKDRVLAARREAEKAVAAGQASESLGATSDSKIEEVEGALIKPAVANRAAGMVEGLRRPLAS